MKTETPNNPTPSKLFIRCEECRYWKTDRNRYNGVVDPKRNPATLKPWRNQEEKRQWLPYQVRYCKSPKAQFYQRPHKDGISVFDGSEYLGYLAAGPEYGCVNGKAKPKKPETSDAVKTETCLPKTI